MNPDLIPLHDEFGIPAWPWVFVLLKEITLVIHFIFMGYVMTMALLQIFWSAAAREGSAAEWMLRRTEKFMPIALSFTITLGVAPLLFVQVLYQPFFYTSNILLGHLWFGIIIMLILGFYLIYLVYGGHILGHRLGRFWETAARVAIFLCFFYILSMHTINAVLVLNPERWRAVQAAGGNPLAIGDPILWPRLIHNFLAAIIIGTVWMVAFGLRSAKFGENETSREAGAAMAKLGGFVGAFALVFQTMAGLWLYVVGHESAQQALIANPEVLAEIFAGKSMAILWMVAASGPLLLLVGLFLAISLKKRWALGYLWGALGLVLLGMFSGRELVRQARLAQLSKPFSLNDWTINPQISSLLVFLGMFVVALVVVATMLVWMHTAWTAPEASAKPADRAF